MKIMGYFKAALAGGDANEVVPESLMSSCSSNVKCFGVLGFFNSCVCRNVLSKILILISLYKNIKYLVTIVFTDSTAEYGVAIHIYAKQLIFYE